MGFLLIAWLAYQHRRGLPLPGCGAGSGCDHVTASRWSRWFGMSVALPAFLAYFGMLGAAVCVVLKVAGDAVMLQMMLAIAIMLGGAAVWFVILQAVVLRRFCAYCSTLHVIGIASAALALSIMRAAGPPSARWPSYAAAAGVAVLIAGQLLVAPRLYRIEPASAEAPTSPQVPLTTAPRTEPRKQVRSGRSVPLLSNRLSLALDDWPILGNRDSTNVIACLFDYTCPQCRKTHQRLRTFSSTYPGGLAVLLLPVPMDPACNPYLHKRHVLHAHACRYARLAMALWLTSPAAYNDYDQWFFETDEAPPLGIACAKAAELICSKSFDADAPDPEIDAPILQALEIYKAIGTGRVPMLLLPHATFTGDLPPNAELMSILAEQLSSIRWAPVAVAFKA